MREIFYDEFFAFASCTPLAQTMDVQHAFRELTPTQRKEVLKNYVEHELMLQQIYKQQEKYGKDGTAVLKSDFYDVKHGIDHINMGEEQDGN